MNTRMRTLSTLRLTAITLGLGLAAAPSCSTPAERRPDTKAEDTIIGRPPPARDDPFADTTLPPDAKPAPASGYMGEDNTPRPRPMPDNQRALTTRAPRPDDTPKPTVTTPKPTVTTPKPTTTTPTPAVAIVTRPRDPDLPARTSDPDAPHQCFSCVRVCAVEDAANGCAESPEDMICGWGASGDRANAQRMAQAQCDATLNMARDMPMWRSIEGTCPPASCR